MGKVWIIPLLILMSFSASSQIEDDDLGAWYMYFWSAQFGDSPWGLQGDVQYRNWNVIGDLEQLLLRGGFTYTPRNTTVKFTLGYANIQTGAFGSDDNSTTGESRIYQEALIPQRIGDSRIYLTHRFRFEQRFVDNQDFRTRYRYNLFVNIALNSDSFDPGTFYFALYNELFLNGQRDIGDGRRVEIFDRNRFYTGLGYVIANPIKVQLGWMRQVTDQWGKNQIQVSAHHSF